MHEPIEVEVEVYEEVGGVLVYSHNIIQIRCGCTYDLSNDWGHHEN